MYMQKGIILKNKKIRNIDIVKFVFANCKNELLQVVLARNTKEFQKPYLYILGAL